MQIKEEGKRAVQGNCLRCHFQTVDHVSVANYGAGELEGELKSRYCWECHRLTPHGRTRSESATPYSSINLDYEKPYIKFEK